MTRTDHRNARLLAAGERLTAYIAANATNAVRSIDERLQHLDGYPGTASGTDRVRGTDAAIVRDEDGELDSVVLTSTERTAARRYMLASTREDLREAITDVCSSVDSLNGLIDEILRNEYPRVDGRVCCDGQSGREGVIEWGDALCRYAPVKAGLCARHYMRWYRYRVDHGLPTDRDFAA